MDDRGATMKTAVGLLRRSLAATLTLALAPVFSIVKDPVLAGESERLPVIHEGAEREAARAHDERPRVGRAIDLARVHGQAVCPRRPSPANQAVTRFDAETSDVPRAPGSVTAGTTRHSAWPLRSSTASTPGTRGRGSGDRGGSNHSRNMGASTAREIPKPHGENPMATGYRATPSPLSRRTRERRLLRRFCATIQPTSGWPESSPRKASRAMSGSAATTTLQQ